MPRIPDNLEWRASTFSGGGDGGGESIEVAFDEEEGMVYLRESDHPEKVVITTRVKWDVFVLGVQAGEFDHFVEE